MSTTHDGAPMPDEVLTTKEVATLPDLVENTVYKGERDGEG